MTTLKQIVDYLAELLQPGLFSDYCTNGMQVEGKQKAVKLCSAVSASINAISQTVEQKGDILLVHHGIFWQRDSYDIIGTTRAKLKLLLSHDISLLAYHLPLDAHSSLGNNWKAAMDLGWNELLPFPANDKRPIGVKGAFSPRPRKQFLDELKAYYGNAIDCVEGGKEMVASAALVSGGAHKMILDAIQDGADCFITGTRDEPTWHQAYENKINFFAVGHAASEEIGVKSLGEHLAARFSLEHCWIKESNPF